MSAAGSAVMTAITAAYLESAVLLLMGGLMTAALVRFGGALVAAAPARWLRWAWVLLGLVLALPWAWRLGAGGRPRGAPIEIVSFGAAEEVTGAARDAGALRFVWRSPSPGAHQAGLTVERAALRGAALVLGAGVFWGGLRLLLRRRRLACHLARLPVCKRVGRVWLCAADQATAPFAARARGLAFIVVPTALLRDPARLRLVVSHEVLHHRHGDLLGATLLGILRVLFFWNPAAALWERVMAELQDLTCDRRVLERRRVSAVDYGRCLLWAAEHGRAPLYRLVGTRGMAASSADALRRRILMIDGQTKTGSRSVGGVGVGVATLMLLLGTSWAVRGAVEEHRVSRAQLASAAARIEARAGFPVLVDDRVLDALNRRVGTPEARTATKAALARMRGYRPMVEDVLRRRGLPVELVGMALAESGFDNEARPDRPAPRQAAGIWQLLPATARRFGLAVSDVADERLEPRRSTEAAAALLLDLHQRFGDWPIAIAAYNGGRSAVEALTQGQGGPEARARILASDAECGRYLAAVMAAVVLVENPALGE